MVRFNVIHNFSVYVYLSFAVLESHSNILNRYNGCPPIHLLHGRVKLLEGGRMARITCNRSFKLVLGSKIMECVRRKWNQVSPVCESEQFSSSCDFESSEERFCGWHNDRFNDVDWLADKSVLFWNPNIHHVKPGPSQYFSNNYISLDAGNYGSSFYGKLKSPFIPPVFNKQRCLIFSYKVLPGSSFGAHTLSVIFGDIPHWMTSVGEGKAIIGLYNFNITSQIIIEGKNCKAAIDNIIITEDHSCSQKPYEDEIDTCHDNCGKITYDDDSCSCDWECHYNNNCCSDISSKCPFIRPLQEINRLYLTKSTLQVVKMTTVLINTSNFTISSTTPSKIINEPTIPNDPLTISTPMNKHYVLLNSTVNSTLSPHKNTSQINFLFNTTTEKSTDIPKLNNSLIFNSTSFLDITSNSKTTAIPITFSDKIITTTTTPMITPNVTPNILGESKTTAVTPVENFNSTIKHLVMNTAYASRPLNTFNITTKSLMGNQFSNTNSINIFNGTIEPPNFTTKSVSVITTTKPEGKKPIHTFNFTIQPLMTITSSIIHVPNITNESLINNSTNSTKLINSSTMKIFPSEFNESNSFEQSSTTFITKSLNAQNITQNDVTTESKVTINNSTTLLPTRKIYSVPNKDIDFDVAQTNLNLSHFIYETNTYLYNYSDKLPFNIDNIPNETTASTMLNTDHTSTEDMKISDYLKSFSVSDVVIIVKYLAALGAVLITVKYGFSFIRRYFKKPIDDDMNSYIIKTDNENTSIMELKYHPM